MKFKAHYANDNHGQHDTIITSELVYYSSRYCILAPLHVVNKTSIYLTADLNLNYSSLKLSFECQQHFSVTDTISWALVVPKLTNICLKR